jgi:hypothetical protein
MRMLIGVVVTLITILSTPVSVAGPSVAEITAMRDRLVIEAQEAERECRRQVPVELKSFSELLKGSCEIARLLRAQVAEYDRLLKSRQ